MNINTPPHVPAGKFSDPDLTAKGERRAIVPFEKLETLWFNTGSLCNIACVHCYIESSPKNDALVYLCVDEVRAMLDEIRQQELGTRQIAFTGGEPFMNPDMIPMLRLSLERGFEVLVLTNAMRPLQRPRIQAALLELQQEFGDRLALRVSLDHFSRQNHDAERGAGSWDVAMDGLDWLSQNGFTLHIAGRTLWNESEAVSRAGYAQLIARRNWPVDPCDAAQLVLFPEISEDKDVPEISEKCWDILGTRPDQQMCATSRMVVKRKGAKTPVVLPCTLIAYDPAFDMGETLKTSMQADGGMFASGGIKLCHPFCARFCVLGGGSCTV